MEWCCECAVLIKNWVCQPATPLTPKVLLYIAYYPYACTTVVRVYLAFVLTLVGLQNFSTFVAEQKKQAIMEDCQFNPNPEIKYTKVIMTMIHDVTKGTCIAY